MTISQEHDFLGTEQLVRGGTTLWFQLAERLRQAIADGHLKPGDQLPTESELMERFNVGRSTARAAMGALEVDGLIWRGQGRGTFVKQRTDQRVTYLTSLDEATRRRGYTPSSRTLQFERVIAPTAAATRLGLDAGAVALYLNRILLADGEPIGLHHSFMPVSLLGGGELFTIAELDRGSIRDLITSRGVPDVGRATQLISAEVATEERAAMLEVPEGSALLKIDRLLHDVQGVPSADEEFWYRADKYRVSVEVERQNADLGALPQAPAAT